MSKIPGSIFLKCFSPGAEGAQKLSLGHPKWSRNGSRMVDMRNGDWEMDRTGPRTILDHSRPPKPSKNVNKLEHHTTGAKNRQKTLSLSPIIPLWGGSYWPPIGLRVCHISEACGMEVSSLTKNVAGLAAATGSVAWAKAKDHFPSVTRCK